MKLARYIRPMRFRVYEEADLDACLTLWRANEGVTIPLGHEWLFVDALKRRDGLYLVGELEGRVVCGGGVGYHGSQNAVWLSFGLVDPALQRGGLGTTLLLARLAMLEVGESGCTVRMEVTPNSCTFYQRFGFENLGVRADGAGNLFADFSREILPGDVAMCRELLAGGGAELPAGFKVPVG